MLTIPQYFVTAWDSAIRESVQQRDSRLVSRITDRGHITGEAFTINGEGTIEASPNNVRHGDTEWSELPATVRLVYMRDFYDALPMDRNDEPKMLVNPLTGGNYAKQLTNAYNRQKDRIIYAAALGSQLLKDGTSIVLPASQKIVGGGTGLTRAKIVQAQMMFRANEADSYAGEELTMLYNSVAAGQILSDTTLTSGDFLSGRMLQEGKVAEMFLGFTWIPFEGMNNASGVYSTVAFAKSGIEWGTGYEEGKVSPRPDKKDLTQVSYGASYGAGRQDEKKVVQIDFQ